VPVSPFSANPHSPESGGCNASNASLCSAVPSFLSCPSRADVRCAQTGVCYPTPVTRLSPSQKSKAYEHVRRISVKVRVRERVNKNVLSYKRCFSEGVNHCDHERSSSCSRTTHVKLIISGQTHRYAHTHTHTHTHAGIHDLLLR